jgi:hypothetical protein
MDILTTILACSLYLEDDALVRAIAESSSQSNPYFVLDASVDPTEIDPPPPPKTLDGAVDRARDVTSKGGRPLLGLMQVPPLWLEAFGRELRDAFDPCVSVAIGTAMLSQFDFECAAQEVRSAHPRNLPATGRDARRRCVVEKYAQAIGLPDFVPITHLELRYQRPMRPPVEDAPIFPPSSARAWGPDRILVFPMTRSLLPSLAP